MNSAPSSGVPPLEGAVGGLKPPKDQHVKPGPTVPPLEGAVGGLKRELRRLVARSPASHRSKERWVGSNSSSTLNSAPSSGVPPLEGAVGGLKPPKDQHVKPGPTVPPLEGAVGGLKRELRRLVARSPASHRSKERWVG